MHFVSTIGSWITAVALALMFWNLWQGMRHGPKVGKNPWGGATLEWTLPSPPPHHNFPSVPVVDRGPYDFSGVKADDA
jgi:cytochrome c oxidase subunit 1